MPYQSKPDKFNDSIKKQRSFDKMVTSVASGPHQTMQQPLYLHWSPICTESGIWLQLTLLSFMLVAIAKN